MGFSIWETDVLFGGEVPVSAYLLDATDGGESIYDWVAAALGVNMKEYSEVIIAKIN